jgi:hypothetical protein
MIKYITKPLAKELVEPNLLDAKNANNLGIYNNFS